MADLKELESRVRLLAREGAQSDAPHPRLVLATMLKTLPERLSPGCSANLREGVLVMRLIDEIQPLAPAM